MQRILTFLKHPLFLCGLSFSLCFALGLLLFFPLEIYTRQLEGVAQQQGLELQFESPGLLFPPGLGADGLTVEFAQLQRPPFRFSDIDITPSWASLAGDNPGFNFRAKLMQGEIVGSAYRNGETEINLSALKIDESLGPKLPLTLSGDLDLGKFSGTLPMEGKNSSELQLEMSGLQLSGLQKVGATEDVMPLGQLQGSFQVTGPRVEISSFELSGPALMLQGSGALRLAATPSRSRVNLTLTLTPGDSLDPMLGEMLSLMKKPQADGSYRLQLVGTLANARLK